MTVTNMERPPSIIAAVVAGMVLHATTRVSVVLQNGE